MSDYVDQNSPKEKLKFRFRWGYVVAGFLVFGVLSLTIGTDDPLLRDAQALKQKYDRTFKINKDEKTANRFQLDGPEEKTWPLDAPTLQAFVGEVKQFGDRLSAESFSRASQFEQTSPQIQAVADAAVIYHEIEKGIYRNYMRLAHDAKFGTYRNPTFWNELLGRGFGVLMTAGTAGSVGGYTEGKLWERARWEKANKGVLASSGARAFSPELYNFLDVRISPKVAYIFYSNKQYGMQFSVRNIKDENGRYGQAELFLNEFDKQISEYEALQDPHDKGEYMKLLQFAALREGMANRWALRRLLPEGTSLPTQYVPKDAKYDPRGPIAFADPEITSCGDDLVSFRVPKKGSLNDLPAYSSLWQQDRYDDLMASEPVDAAWKATTNKPLLGEEEYADLYLTYVAEFPEFPARVLAKFNADGDATKAMNQVRLSYRTGTWGGRDRPLVYYLSQLEEQKWSAEQPIQYSDGTTGTIVMAREKFLESNFPADNLSIPAVAERYADEAFAMRASGLIYSLAGIAEVDSDTIDGVKLPDGSKPEVTENKNEYYEALTGGEDSSKANQPASNQVLLYAGAKDPKAYQRAAELVKKILEPKEKAWKEEVRKSVEAALLSKLGVSVVTANGNPMGVGFTNTGAKARYDAYEKDVMTNAAVGARGLQMKEAAAKAAKVMADAQKRYIRCGVNRSGLSGASYCWLQYEDPAKIQDKKNPNYYVGLAPFRMPAEHMKLTELIVPESADQLSQFFRKKLQAVMEFDNETTNYEEPKIAREIAGNQTVMRGIDALFGYIAQLSQKQGSEGTLNDCGNTLSRIGKVKPSRKRAPASGAGELTPEECSQPDNDQALARRKALNGALVAGAKKAYEEFLKGLETPGQYRYQERAKARLAEIEAEKKKRAEEEKRKSEEKPTPQSKEIQAREKEKRDADLFKQYGYFWTGKDHSLDKTGGEFYVEKKEDREKAKRLYVEALGMLRLAIPTVNAPSLFRTKNKYLPDQPVSWVTSEELLSRSLPRLTLLERMVATVTDQYAMGEVLAEESITRSPVLTLSRDWRIPRGMAGWFSSEKRGKKDDPILLERLKPYWSAKGWNEAAFHEEFRTTIYSALASDLGKVETYCAADVKRYQRDPNFRKMFESITGVRQMLSGDPKIQKWDEEIGKDTKTFEDRFITMFEDMFGGHTLWMMLVMIGVQMGIALATGGSSLVLESLSWSAFPTFVARFVALQFTGNLGLLNLAFTLQSVAMVHMYHFRMPPQLGFNFEVANSQIMTMESNRFDGTNATKFSNGNFVDRDRLNAMREELTASQVGSYIAVGMEAFQFKVFTYPGIKKTLGLTAQKYVRSLASASTKSISLVSTDSLPALIRKYGAEYGRLEGTRKAIAEYWPKMWKTLASAQRTVTVKSGDVVRRTLQEMLSMKVAKEVFPTRSVLKDFLEKSRDALTERMGKLIPKLDEHSAEVLARTTPEERAELAELRRSVGERKEIHQQFTKISAIEKDPIQFTKLGPEAQEALEALRKEVGDVDDYWENIVVDGERLKDLIQKSKGSAGDRISDWFLGFKERKLARLAQEQEEFGKMIQALEEAPTGTLLEGDVETSAFMRTLTVDQLMLMKESGAPGMVVKTPGAAGWPKAKPMGTINWPWKWGRPFILELKDRAALSDAFHQFDYLTEDWKRTSGVTDAYKRLALHELPRLIISADGDKPIVWDAKDFKAMPDGTYLGERVAHDEKGHEIGPERYTYKIDPTDFYLHPEEYISVPAAITEKKHWISGTTKHEGSVTVRVQDLATPDKLDKLKADEEAKKAAEDAAKKDPVQKSIRRNKKREQQRQQSLNKPKAMDADSEKPTEQEIQATDFFSRSGSFPITASASNSKAGASRRPERSY